MEHPDFYLFIACPSGWNEEQVRAYKDLINSTLPNGLTVSKVVKESDAAYEYARLTHPDLFENRSWMVIDYGSSTMDITYYSTDGGKRTQTIEIGGQEIERTFVEYIRSTNPSDQEYYNLCNQYRPADQVKERFEYAMREKKEVYYLIPPTRVYNPGIRLSTIVGIQNEFNQAASFGRTFFLTDDIIENTILSDYIGRLRDVLTMLRDNYRPDVVVLTGGSSQLSFFPSLVEDILRVRSDETLMCTDPSISVSHGIAIRGYQECVSKLPPPPPSKDEFIRSVHEQLDDSWTNNLIQDLENKNSELYLEKIGQLIDNYKEGCLGVCNYEVLFQTIEKYHFEKRLLEVGKQTKGSKGDAALCAIIPLFLLPHDWMLILWACLICIARMFKYNKGEKVKTLPQINESAKDNSGYNSIKQSILSTQDRTALITLFGHLFYAIKYDTNASSLREFAIERISNEIFKVYREMYGRGEKPDLKNIELTYKLKKSGKIAIEFIFRVLEKVEVNTNGLIQCRNRNFRNTEADPIYNSIKTSLVNIPISNISNTGYYAVIDSIAETIYNHNMVNIKDIKQWKE